MAASMRLVTCLRRFYCQNFIYSTQKVLSRGYKKRQRRELSALYNLRTEIGPEPERHRSVWQNWNYDSELFSFAKRLGEDLNEETLRVVFSHRSYIEREKKKREELGIDPETLQLNLQDNEDLANQGEELASCYIKMYLRHVYPLMFEEGIGAIHDYVTSEEKLNYIGRHLGITDLMLCADFPAHDSSVVKTLKAVIGAIHNDQGKDRAHLFIRDFILPQLIGKDINEMWNIVNPMGLLTAILNSQNRGLPEPRLLWQGAKSTIMAVFHVGIYSDKELIGQAPGETVVIAEEMAARDCLKRFMKTADSRPSVILEKISEKKNLDKHKTNISVEDFLLKNTPKETVSVSST